MVKLVKDLFEGILWTSLGSGGTGGMGDESKVVCRLCVEDDFNDDGLSAEDAAVGAAAVDGTGNLPFTEEVAGKPSMGSNLGDGGTIIKFGFTILLVSLELSWALILGTRLRGLTFRLDLLRFPNSEGEGLGESLLESARLRPLGTGGTGLGLLVRPLGSERSRV
jgi:hypothetical protein